MPSWLREAQRDPELQSFVDAEVLNGDWHGVAEQPLRLLDGHRGRLGIHGPFWGWTLASYDTDVRAVVRKRMDQALDVCDALNATHVVIHSLLTKWGYNHRGLYPKDTARMQDALHDTLHAALTRADDKGVTFVLENIEHKDTAKRATLCWALVWKALALSLGIGHANYAHGSKGAPPVVFCIHAAGNRLGHMHLQDTDGYSDRHWQLGHGNILWHSVFAALSEITSNPSLIIELRDKAGVIPSARHLANLCLVI